MTAQAPQIWQIATGDDGRRYIDFFKKYDVMFLGPGYPGKFDELTYRDASAKGLISSDERSRVARFATQVRKGDYVLARSGKKVELFGTVTDSKCDHLAAFDDIHGWDVSHAIRVCWHDDAEQHLVQLQANEPLYAHLKQVPTFTRADAGVEAKIAALLTTYPERPLQDLPPTPPSPLDRETLSHELFARGVSHEAVHRVCTAIDKIRRLVDWYQRSHFATGRPTEHEVVAHIILPIMVALNWSEQFLAIEWGRRDLAAFLAVPTDKSNCKLVVEAKEMSHGLQGVFEQAKGYTADLPNCDRILVTNGVRNYLYSRTSDGWKHTHYFNLDKLRTDHVCHPGMNAVDAIVALTPASVAR
jgi:hypothetical protein